MERVFNDELYARVGKICPGMSKALNIDDLLKRQMLDSEVAAVVDVNQAVAVVQRTIDTDTIAGALSRFQVLKWNTAMTKLEIYAETEVEDEAMGTADGHKTAFSGFVAIDDGEFVSRDDAVVITAGAVELTDNGQGKIVDGDGDPRGNIDYESGFVSVAFEVAPAEGDNPTISYVKKSGKAAAILLESAPTGNDSYSAYVLEMGYVYSSSIVDWSDSVARDLKERIRTR